jgi:hypothetical protein
MSGGSRGDTPSAKLTFLPPIASRVDVRHATETDDRICSCDRKMVGRTWPVRTRRGTLDGVVESPKSPMTVADLRRALSATDSTALVFVVLAEDGYHLTDPAETVDEVGHPFEVEIARDAPVVYLRPCRHRSKLRRDGV